MDTNLSDSRGVVEEHMGSSKANTQTAPQRDPVRHGKGGSRVARYNELGCLRKQCLGTDFFLSKTEA
jgi:hypothetical protein